jgi:hypothetical protein
MPSCDGVRRERRRSSSGGAGVVTVGYRAATARSVDAETPVLHALEATILARAATSRRRVLEDGGNAASY